MMNSRVVPSTLAFKNQFFSPMFHMGPKAWEQGQESSSWRQCILSSETAEGEPRAAAVDVGRDPGTKGHSQKAARKVLLGVTLSCRRDGEGGVGRGVVIGHMDRVNSLSSSLNGVNINIDVFCLSESSSC